MHLKNKELFQQKCYIDGQWLSKDSGATLDVFNPVDGTKLGVVPNGGQAETEQAILAANRAWPLWRKKTAKERAALLKRWHQLILDNQEDLAHLITLEQGKPLNEALEEVNYAASFIEWFVSEAVRVYGDVIPAPGEDEHIIVVKQSIGVVAAITPWNFPAAMITRKCAPALSVGCTIVLKPAEDTPFTALALVLLAERAGIPPGVFNVVTGQPEAIGKEMCSNPLVRKISFTGSTPVGRLLMSQSSSTIKKVSLELGGNAPFIVFDDADIDAAIVGLMACKFRNMGQSCICANRILIQSGVYQTFIEKFSAAIAQHKLGNGFEAGVTQGPLINQAALDKVQRLVDDAVAKGAKIVKGGKSAKAVGPLFYEPTILTEVTPLMAITQEEIFGPVAAFMRFESVKEVIQIANDTIYGLAAYFYSRDMARIWQVAERLEYGMVGINTGRISAATVPFGGVKQSGIGREGSKYGVDEFIECKTLYMKSN